MTKQHSDVYPTSLLKADKRPDHDGDEHSSPALIILNQPIADTEVLDRLWNHTSYRVCADGGANHLYDLFNRDLPSSLDQYVRPPQHFLCRSDL